jgi:hypothetical protein
MANDLLVPLPPQVLEFSNECVLSLLDFVERIETLRGTGRLFIP